MAQTSNTVRRAMKRLGYTNQSLADHLTSVRMDGQTTSPATVSRWVTGASPVKPALILYLKERLAGLVMESEGPNSFDSLRRISIDSLRRLSIEDLLESLDELAPNK